MSRMRSSARTRLLGPIAVLLACFAAAPTFAAASGAVTTVETLHATLLDVMKAGSSLTFAARRDKLAPVIEKAFDLPYIVQIIMGRYWSTLSADQRKRLVETFTRLTVATYADRFDGYDGERFVTRSEQNMRNDRVAVRTAIERPGKKDVTLDYVLQKSGGAWRIVNVVADGVSDLALKRADYGSVMSRDGFDTLLRKLEAQVAEHSKGGKG